MQQRFLKTETSSHEFERKQCEKEQWMFWVAEGERGK